MIAFKDPRDIVQWKDLNRSLLEVLLFANAIWPDQYMEITRIWDPRTLEEARAAGESGIHTSLPHRSADARTKDLEREKSTQLVNRINTTFQYDPARPEKKVAIEHGETRHLHLQVSRTTRRRIVEIVRGGSLT